MSNVTFENLPAIVENLAEKINELVLKIESQENRQPETEQSQFIYGIKGLAQFLNVSPPTAQKIKASGKIPYSQSERTIIFKKSDVLKALENKKTK